MDYNKISPTVTVFSCPVRFLNKNKSTYQHIKVRSATWQQLWSINSTRNMPVFCWSWPARSRSWCLLCTLYRFS